MALEELADVAEISGDIRALPSVAIALERLDRRGVRAAGDLVVVGEGSIWWYWPEMAIGLEPSEVCDRLNNSDVVPRVE